MRMVVVLLALAGCADDEPADPYQCIAGGGQACFQLPTDILAAADASGAITTPVLDCPGYEVTQSTAPVMFTGTTIDALDRETAIPAVRLEIFADAAMTAPLIDVTSDEAGAWAATVGTMPSLAYGRTSQAGELPLYFLDTRLDVAQAQQYLAARTATRAQLASVLEGAGDQFLPGKTQLQAVAYDCAGNRLLSAIANVAPASAKRGSRLFEPGVRVYYGTDDPVPRLARRTELHMTTTSGTIGVSNLSPGKHFIQLWGFPTEADLAIDSVGLELLAETELLVFEGEAGIIMPLYARL